RGRESCGGGWPGFGVPPRMPNRPRGARTSGTDSPTTDSRGRASRRRPGGTATPATSAPRRGGRVPARRNRGPGTRPPGPPSPPRDTDVLAVGREPFPEGRLPASDEGWWLDVALCSRTATCDAQPQPFFLPVAGPAFQCPCRPYGPHSCLTGQRADRLYLSFE